MKMPKIHPILLYLIPFIVFASGIIYARIVGGLEAIGILVLSTGLSIALFFGILTFRITNNWKYGILGFLGAILIIAILIAL